MYSYQITYNRLKNGKSFNIVEIIVNTTITCTNLSIDVKIISYDWFNFKAHFKWKNSLEKYKKNLCLTLWNDVLRGENFSTSILLSIYISLKMSLHTD